MIAGEGAIFWYCPGRLDRPSLFAELIDARKAAPARCPAAYAGGQAMDVSAALFPAWGYVAADAPQMRATMRVLERDYSQGVLYWRHLERLGRFEVKLVARCSPSWPGSPCPWASSTT